MYTLPYFTPSQFYVIPKHTLNGIALSVVTPFTKEHVAILMHTNRRVLRTSSFKLNQFNFFVTKPWPGKPFLLPNCSSARVSPINLPFSNPISTPFNVNFF
jgi:hypothetical protein